MRIVWISLGQTFQKESYILAEKEFFIIRKNLEIKSSKSFLSMKYWISQPNKLKKYLLREPDTKKNFLCPTFESCLNHRATGTKWRVCSVQIVRKRLNQYVGTQIRRKRLLYRLAVHLGAMFLWYSWTRSNSYFQHSRIGCGWEKTNCQNQ